MSEQIQNEFMTTAEAAEMLGIHPSTAGQYCQAGELEAVKVGVAWAITRASVERLAAARRVDPTSVTAYQQRGTKQAEPVAKPRKPRKEPTPWQARPEFDWTASIRARREDVLHAAISQLRGPGQ